MKERKLTGNQMFELVKDECERILGKGEDGVEVDEKRQNGVLFRRMVNGEWVWDETGDVKKDMSYVGGIKNGVPNGQGTISLPYSSYKYTGGWKDGKRHGEGTFINRDGKYVGEFKDGKYDGYGTLTFPSGGQVVGQWKDGKYHGRSTYTDEKGNVDSGVWKNGKPWNTMGWDKNGKVLFEFRNGVRFPE